MYSASPYHRPDPPPRVVIQGRDRELFEALFRYRYLTAEHIEWLLFTGRRATQARLRKLWGAGYVDRHAVPTVVTAGTHVAVRPLYTLATLGARELAEHTGRPLKAIPSTPTENARGFRRLEHNLVATDLLVSLEGVARGETFTVNADPEATLWRGLAAARETRSSGYLVPDGAVTVIGGDRSLTYLIEIVRADVRRGNASLKAKFARYAELNRKGFFQDVFGYELVRAVVFIASSPERAENLRALAGAMPHGKRLLWFGAYPEGTATLVPTTTFTPAMVPELRFTDALGDVHSFIPPTAHAAA